MFMGIGCGQAKSSNEIVNPPPHIKKRLHTCLKWKMPGWFFVNFKFLYFQLKIYEKSNNLTPIFILSFNKKFSRMN